MTERCGDADPEAAPLPHAVRGRRRTEHPPAQREGDQGGGCRGPAPGSDEQTAGAGRSAWCCARRIVAPSTRTLLPRRGRRETSPAPSRSAGGGSRGRVTSPGALERLADGQRGAKRLTWRRPGRGTLNPEPSSLGAGGGRFGRPLPLAGGGSRGRAACRCGGAALQAATRPEAVRRRRGTTPSRSAGGGSRGRVPCARAVRYKRGRRGQWLLSVLIGGRPGRGTLHPEPSSLGEGGGRSRPPPPALREGDQGVGCRARGRSGRTGAGAVSGFCPFRSVAARVGAPSTRSLLPRRGRREVSPAPSRSAGGGSRGRVASPDALERLADGQRGAKRLTWRRPGCGTLHPNPPPSAREEGGLSRPLPLCGRGIKGWGAVREGGAIQAEQARSVASVRFDRWPPGSAHPPPRTLLPRRGRREFSPTPSRSAGEGSSGRAGGALGTRNRARLSTAMASGRFEG